MKINNSGSSIEIKSSGIGQVIGGVLFVLAGLVLAVYLLSSPEVVDDTGASSEVSPLFSLVGFIMVAIGLFIIFYAKNRRVLINKSGPSRVYSKRVLGGKEESQDFNSSEIVAVNLYTYMDSSGASNGTGNGRKSVLSLILNNNNKIEIAGKGKGGFSINGLNIGSLITKAPLSKEANEIATSLNVPVQSEDVSTLHGAVSSVKHAMGVGKDRPSSTTPGQPQAPTPPSKVAQQPQQPVQPQQPTQQNGDSSGQQPPANQIQQ